MDFFLGVQLHFTIDPMDFLLKCPTWFYNQPNFNDETLATALDRDFVKKFADEFIRLYGEGHPVQQ